MLHIALYYSWLEETSLGHFREKWTIINKVLNIFFHIQDIFYRRPKEFMSGTIYLYVSLKKLINVTSNCYHNHDKTFNYLYWKNTDMKCLYFTFWKQLYTHRKIIQIWAKCCKMACEKLYKIVLYMNLSI